MSIKFDMESGFGQRLEYDFASGTHMAVEFTPEKLMKLREREFEKFLSGRYKDLPPEVYRELFRLGINVDHDVFLHVSVMDDTMVAYTPTLSRLITDKPQRLRIGKMLQLHGHGHASPHISSLYARAIGNYELAFAHSAQDIRYVYENGPESCMGKSKSNFYGLSIHPAEVYAGSGDIAVAYMYHRVKGTISARAVVNFRDKQYVRIYGNPLMQDALADAGYSYSCMALEGCRIRRVLFDSSEDYYIAPYIDGDANVAYETSDPDYFVLGFDGSREYPLYATRTDGRMARGKICDCCESHVSINQLLRTADDQMICDSCASDHYRWAYNEYRNQLLYPEDEVRWSDLDCEYYTLEAYEEFFVQDYLGDEQFKDDCIICHFTSEWVSEEDAIVVLLPDGKTVQAAPNDEEFVYSEHLDTYLIASEAIEDWHYPA